MTLNFGTAENRRLFCSYALYQSGWRKHYKNKQAFTRIHFGGKSSAQVVVKKISKKMCTDDTIQNYLNTFAITSLVFVGFSIFDLQK